MIASDRQQMDVHCDVCNCSTRMQGFGEQFGVLQALWGYGSQHDGERYRVRICEVCFFQVLTYMRQERRISRLFEEDPSDDHAFGQVARDEFWGSSS